MQMTFKNTSLIIMIGIILGINVETQCMRRVMPALLRRSYSLPRIPLEAAEKISAIDKKIAEQQLLKKQIYQERLQAMLRELKAVSFKATLFGSCYVPIYGLKSLLVSGGVIVAAIPFIRASYPLTPYNKRLITQYESAIHNLEAQKVALYKENYLKN